MANGLTRKKTEADLAEEEILRNIDPSVRGAFSFPPPSPDQPVDKSITENLLLHDALENQSPAAQADFARAADLDEQEKRKHAVARAEFKQGKIDGGSTEVMPADFSDIPSSIPGIPPGFFDENTNNQPDPFDELNRKLFATLEDPSDLNAIREALREEKAAEEQNQEEMLIALRELKEKKAGIDLTPLAGLIDDPNKARILAQTLSPAFSEEDKRKAVSALEQRFRDRKDAFRKSRSALQRELARQTSTKEQTLIKAAIAGANQKEARAASLDAKKQRQFQREITAQNKAMTDAKKEFKKDAKEERNALADLRESVDKVELFAGSNKNALAASTFRFELVRAAQQGGVITDADLEAVGASPQLLNQVEELWEKYFVSGEPFTNKTDLPNIIALMKATMRSKLRRINERLDQASSQLNEGYRSSITGQNNIWGKEKLREEGEIFATSTWVDPKSLRAVERLDLIQQTDAAAAPVKGAEKDRLDKVQSDLKDAKRRLSEIQGSVKGAFRD